MSPRKKFLPLMVASLALLTLILDARAAITGAQEGLELCLRTVIPVLFPFTVLCVYISSHFIGSSLPFLRPLAKLCKIPQGAESILLLGMAGGYPVGAQCIAEMYRCGAVSSKDARRMLGFCNNAGPSFLFGMASLLFSDPSKPWLLFLVQVISSLLTGALLPGSLCSAVEVHRKKPISIQESMSSALRSTAKVCGWIILFRILIGFFQRWFLWYFPKPVQILFMGVLELSNGILSLMEIPSEDLRFILCAALMNLGGICVYMQTAAVTKELGTGFYAHGKLMQCLFSVIMALILVTRNTLLIFALLCLLLIIPIWKLCKKRKMGIAFRRILMYNVSRNHT